ncbi:hypothetical protein LV457_11305 [Mycobacterium sp. MYCO198283]|uniref:hypothetical protein n=1 Tax=Mycobacterium sp. MYCO198283 TaxID=2883505 RepID=UPI001E57C3D9|nr:hypothetical protein [Mycobacterium sp. MYCO198283]MCG5432871.1 hypothetical protein [Mycobacterium sp. MYCO198283]
MTETSNTPTTVVERRSRLTTIALWVGIVVGVVFIVGAIFWTGFALGSHGGHGGHDGPRGDRSRGDMMVGPDHRVGPPALLPGVQPGQQPGPQPGQSTPQQPTTTPSARP